MALARIIYSRRSASRPGLPVALALALILAAHPALLQACSSRAKDATFNIGYNFHMMDFGQTQSSIAPAVEAMVAEARARLGQAHIEIDSVQIYMRTGAQAQRLTNIDVDRDEDFNGWPDDVEELFTLSSGSKRHNMDIFFVKSIGANGILGMAGGIPGPSEKGTRRSGVLINTFGGLNQMTPTELELQGSTLIHETIHYLGVYHTTERNGRDFDPLVDTPECPKSSFDHNSDGVVSPGECAGQDGEYLMFWATGSYPQNVISGDQISVMKVHPFIRKI